MHFVVPSLRLAAVVIVAAVGSGPQPRATEPVRAPAQGEPRLAPPSAGPRLLTRFKHNRRLHIFIADAVTRRVEQLTRGKYYEHSIDWSPA